MDGIPESDDISNLEEYPEKTIVRINESHIYSCKTTRKQEVNILIVDDNPFNLNALEIILKNFK